MSEREKLTQKKLLSLTPTLAGRLNRVAAMREEDATEIIRRGLCAELDRLEAAADVETQRMEKLRKLAAAQGGDVDVVLDRMILQLTDPELPLPVESVA